MFCLSTCKYLFRHKTQREFSWANMILDRFLTQQMYFKFLNGNITAVRQKSKPVFSETCLEIFSENFLYLMDIQGTNTSGVLSCLYNWMRFQNLTMENNHLINDLIGEAPSFPEIRFMDMLNDTNISLNLNLTIQDVLNPANDFIQRKNYRNLSKLHGVKLKHSQR